MAKLRRKSAPEIIATMFCTDIADVRDGIYQPTVYSNPSVYTYGDNFYCCPLAGRKPPKGYGFKWKSVYTDTQTSRHVFEATGEL